jgi:hypothetical protein
VVPEAEVVHKESVGVLLTPGAAVRLLSLPLLLPLPLLRLPTPPPLSLSLALLRTLPSLLLLRTTLHSELPALLRLVLVLSPLGCSSVSSLPAAGKEKEACTSAVCVSVTWVQLMSLIGGSTVGLTVEAVVCGCDGGAVAVCKPGTSGLRMAQDQQRSVARLLSAVGR